MGWKESTSLGNTSNGLIAPIQIEMKSDTMGLGQKQVYEKWTNADNVKRKILTQEKEETEEERIIRIEKAKQLELLQKNIKDINRTFYCKLCNKQYKRASEWDTHLSSYDHNHKKVIFFLFFYVFCNLIFCLSDYKMLKHLKLL